MAYPTTWIITVCFIFSHSCSTNFQPGLELARLADLPADVLTEAQRVAKSLAETDLHDKEQSQTSKISIRRKALLRVLLPLSGLIHWFQLLIALSPLLLSSFASFGHSSHKFWITPSSRKRISSHILLGFRRTSRRFCVTHSDSLNQWCCSRDIVP